LLQAEAEAAEKAFLIRKTWKFSAKNVRDFGIATSRKFILDAMAIKATKTTMAVSIYPKKQILWGETSTITVAHTLKVILHILLIILIRKQFRFLQKIKGWSIL
jgi:hypothetical protein